jgi:hypothetical protein
MPQRYVIQVKLGIVNIPLSLAGQLLLVHHHRNGIEKTYYASVQRLHEGLRGSSGIVC